MLWNRFEELGGDVRNGVRRRFHTLVDTGELDEDRARDWVVVRMLHNAAWRLLEPTVDPEADRDWVTMCIAIAKAVQD
jgi:streptomycin 6-kinase